MRTLFWISCALVGYVYIGYPFLVTVWARLRPQPVITRAAAAFQPRIAILIAARNEGHQIGRRIENLLQLDYPVALRQIVVVSDGSTDDTMPVLARYRGIVDSVAVEAGGKALALNAGVAVANADVLVFADARQAFAPDALRALVAPFQDPRVGAVSGELVLESDERDRRNAAATGRRSDKASTAPPGDRRTGGDRRRTVASTVADGVGLYWRYEKSIRRNESAIGSTLGATGAIYAIRRALWSPLPAGTILDDVLVPMRAVMAGYRSVFAEEARAFDHTAPNARAEARRKIRTLAGNYQLLGLQPTLLLPWRNPVWFQFVSHKLGRLVVPYGLIMLIATSLTLAGRSLVYAAALLGQCVLYLLAGYGAWLDSKGNIEGGEVHA